MACAAAAVHKKKPQSRLLALLALSWACLQTAQPVRALAGPTVRAALFDPRTPAFWLSRCSSRPSPSTSSSLSTGPHRQLRPLRVSPRRAVQASELSQPGEGGDDEDKEQEDLAAARRVQNVAINELETAQQAFTVLQNVWLQEFKANGNTEEAKQAEAKKDKAKEEVEKAKKELAEAKKELKEAEQKYNAKASVQAIKTVSEKDLQNLANISGPKVTIEDWMVGLDICGKKCVKHIQTFAPKSDSDTERVPPLMLSRCMRGGKTTFLAYLFKLVKAETSYLPIFISFNGLSGIQQKKGESRLQTILRAIAVTLLQPSISTDAQSVSVNEDTLREHLERQDGVIVLMIDELNLLVPKGTADNEVASFLQRHFLSRANRYLVFTTHEPFDGSRVAEYTGGKLPYSPRDVIATDLPRSIDVTEQRRIPECRALSVGNVLFFSGIPALLRSWKQQYNFQARFEQLPKPKKTPDLLESFVREFLDGRRQGGDAIRAFDCLTATSDKADVKWILCYAAQMCSYLNQHQLADWINRLQIDASDPLSGKGWEVLVVLAAAFRCLNAMACGKGHGLLGLPPDPNIKACYFLDVPSEVSTYKEALEWWARQDIPPTFPFVAVLNPLCSTFEVFDCILLYQRSKHRVIQVRGFQQKAGCTYPDGAACQGVDCVWMQGKAAEHRRSEQTNGWTLPSAGEIRAFLGASLRDLFPKELDT